jgi:hypothetical protein
MRSFMRMPRRRPLAGAAAVGIALTTAVVAPSLASATPNASAVAACPAASLQVWIGVGEGGEAAGSETLPLEFTNISSTACTLNGAPAVFAANVDGSQLGSAAQQSSSTGTVTLAADTTATANLRFTDTDGFTTSSCEPVSPGSLNVEPPGTTEYFDVPFYEFLACSKSGDIYLASGSISPGVGIP